jgi:hypothetical protein
VKLHHPDLDRTIEVPDGANLGVYKRSGWTEVPDEPAEQPTVPEGSQLLPDMPPADQPKPRSKPRSS